MATYYLWSDASGAANGSSWTDAFTTLESAIAAAIASGDIIKVHKTHVEQLSVDTTYVCQNNISIVCVDKDNSDALAEMDGSTGYIGHLTLSRHVILQGAYKVYVYGLALVVAGTTAKNLGVGTGTTGSFVVERCKLWSLNTAVSPFIYFGNTGTVTRNFIRVKDSEFRFGGGGTSRRIDIAARVELIDCWLHSSSGQPTGGMFQINVRNGALLSEGCDWSVLGANPLVNIAGGSDEAVFVNCKLGSGFIGITGASVNTKADGSLLLLNCSSGDTHYHLGHFDAIGSTVIETGIYANDGASPDGGTTRTSWKITTTAYATYYQPYISPWIDKYHSGTSAITPYLEILRDGSTTAFQDDEVWGEFSYQGTSGSTQSTIVSDRMTLLGTPANQTASSKTVSDWTGESASAWTGQLAPLAAITPAEVGYLRARVCVGEPSTTVYVDPQIRT